MRTLAETARWLELAEAAAAAALVKTALARGEEGLAFEEIGSACAVDCGPESPLRRVYGFGLDGPARIGVLERIVAFFRARGAPARIELTPFADPSWLPALQGRFGVEGFRDVLVRDLAAPPPVGRGVEVREVDLDDPDDVFAAARLVASGFTGSDDPPASWVAHGVRSLRQPDARTFVASVDGVPAGGGTMVVAEGRAALFGASTRAACRRRGVQGALIAARLAAAREAGATVATVQAAPGSGTRRNAERAGFALLYARVTLVGR